MVEIILKLIENPKAQLLLFLTFAMTYLVPCFLLFRIETAIDRLTERMECGAKLEIKAAHYEPREKSKTRSPV